MPFSKKSLEEKPYNRCVNCDHIGKTCDGPNFLAMSAERWCEWCHLRKNYLGWTNAHIADAADLSKASVDRVMAGHVNDVRLTTIQQITKALVNGSWGQYPCTMATDKETATADNPVLVEKCAQLESKVSYLKDQAVFKDEQMRIKDKLLDERADFLRRKDKAITALSLMLGVSVLLIVVALFVDLLHHDMGFFWRH